MKKHKNYITLFPNTYIKTKTYKKTPTKRINFTASLQTKTPKPHCLLNSVFTTNPKACKKIKI